MKRHLSTVLLALSVVGGSALTGCGTAEPSPSNSKANTPAVVDRPAQKPDTEATEDAAEANAVHPAPETPQAVAEVFTKALATGDAVTACGLFSTYGFAEARATAAAFGLVPEGSDCETYVTAYGKLMNVTTVSVSATVTNQTKTQATVEITATLDGATSTNTHRVVVEDGGWRMDGILTSRMDALLT